MNLRNGDLLNAQRAIGSYPNSEEIAIGELESLATCLECVRSTVHAVTDDERLFPERVLVFYVRDELVRIIHAPRDRNGQKRGRS